MNVLWKRFLLANALLGVLALTVVVGRHGEIANEMANLTAPIEAAAQAVVETTDAAGTVASFLPGNFK